MGVGKVPFPEHLLCARPSACHAHQVLTTVPVSHSQPLYRRGNGSPEWEPGLPTATEIDGG